MSPKNLLRHKDCKSHLSEFDDVKGYPGFERQGTRFTRLIKDPNDHKEVEEGINRLILCSGKVKLPLLSSTSKMLCSVLESELTKSFQNFKLRFDFSFFFL